MSPRLAVGPAVAAALAALLAGPAAASSLNVESGQETDGLTVEIDPGERFQTGNQLYQTGDFAGALEAYEAILEAGYDSGDLQYNLGNAYFKLGRLGPAILAYERARRAMPRDENVEANLELARSLTADQITPLPEFWPSVVWRAWVDLLPRQWLVALVVLGYLSAMGLLTWRLATGVRRRWVTVLAGTLAVATAVLAVNLAVRELGVLRSERGVVMVTETAVQSAPADDPSLRLFTIHEGARVRIDRRSAGWVEIVLEDGQVGWLRAESIEII